MRRAGLALILLLHSAYSSRLALAEPAFEPAGQAQIQSVVDGMTVTLSDGRRLRLTGIEAPLRGALAAQAKTALADLVVSRSVELRSAGNPSDRQGRVVAQVYAGSIWVQGELLRRGLARVHSTADNRLGIADMLALERQARRYHRGLWADRAYAVRSADDAVEVTGSFQLVRFKVGEVANSAGQVLISAGPDRRTAFALTLAPSVVKLCRDAGLDPMALKGKQILARGFIDGRVRPTIAITHPEQIEIPARKK